MPQTAEGTFPCPLFFCLCACVQYARTPYSALAHSRVCHQLKPALTLTAADSAPSLVQDTISPFFMCRASLQISVQTGRRTCWAREDDSSKSGVSTCDAVRCGWTLLIQPHRRSALGNLQVQLNSRFWMGRFDREYARASTVAKAMYCPGATVGTKLCIQ